MNTQPAFSTWQPWAQRRTHERLKLPGIYAIAISDEQLTGQPFDWTPHIVYFGMTNSLGGLAQRLKQFDSAINGGPGHGGAMRFWPSTRLAPAHCFTASTWQCGRSTGTCVLFSLPTS